MRAVPIPPEMAKAAGLRTTVLGDADPTRDDVRPCEYIVGDSKLSPGCYTFTALVELDDDDRAAVAKGARLILTLDGGEVPWSIETEAV